MHDAHAQTCRFFVESANGDVEAAVTTYYESGAGQRSPDAQQGGTEADASGPRTLSGAAAPSMPSDWEQSDAPAPSTTSAPRGGRFASLADLRSEEASEPPEGGKDDKDPVNFFTGGERSGLSVQNPDHGRRGQAPDIVQNILKKAAEAGQHTEDDEDSWGRGGPSQSKPTNSFGGLGRTIGSQDSTAQPADSPGSLGGIVAEGAADDDDNADEEVAERNITFWQDGFSIADGPLMRYDDPQHAQTLSLINSGRAPLHLLNVRFGQPVQLRVEQRTNEKYQPPPPPPMKPFGGQGNRLGSSAPPSGDVSRTSSRAASAPSHEPPVEVDASQPVTQLQIRLSDGQRLVAKFNHSHTVGDVRRYIDAAHPDATGRSYTLQTSFPPKPVTDETQSLKDAGLINAVVIQKWT